VLPAGTLPAGYSRPAPRTPVAPFRHAAEPAPSAAGEGLIPGLRRGPLWLELLRAALSARHSHRVSTRARSGVALGGCVMRLLLVVVAAFLALLGTLFFYGRSLLN
jgi:hypothetical protein